MPTTLNPVHYNHLISMDMDHGPLIRCPCCNGSIFLKEAAWFRGGALLADLQAAYATNQEWEHGPE